MALSRDILDTFVVSEIWDDKTIVDILHKNEHPVVPDLKSFKYDKSSEFGVFDAHFKDLLCHQGLKTIKISGTIYSIQLDADYTKGFNQVECTRQERGRRGFCYNSSYSSLCAKCYGPSNAKLSNLEAYSLKRDSDIDFIMPTNKVNRMTIELTKPTIDDIKRRFDEISPQINQYLLALTHDEIKQIQFGFNINDPITDMKKQFADYDILLQNTCINEKLKQQDISVAKQQFWNKEADIIDQKIAELQAQIMLYQKDKQEIVQQKAKISLES